jgi:SAM-dependent methyltransferase
MDDLGERLFQASIAMFDLMTVYLGDRLGLYRALVQGPATSTELAERTGTFERYVREWLEQQAVSGILEVEDEAAGALERRYRLPPRYLEVLTNEDSLAYGAYRGVEMVRGTRRLPELVEAFRTGAPIAPLPWEPEGRAEFNRARYVNLLGKRWLPSIPAIDSRLRADPPARVADLGCGTGWSSISMAKAYPSIRVDGFDLDPYAIGSATRNATREGLEDRVHFRAQDVAELKGAGYDLATVFEALHDMARPVEALRAIRSLLGEGGLALVADELVGEEFTPNPSDQERYMYGWSVVDCLPSSMDGPDPAGTGAVMRPATLRRYAMEAGYRDAEIQPVEDQQWHFYLLHP